MAYGVYVRNPTWADGPGGGTSIDAADLNANDVGVFNAFYHPNVHVTHNATQSLTSGVATALAFNTERFDQAGNAADTMHDTVTNNSRLTCRYAGIYLIHGAVEFAANATGFRQLDIRLNGTTLLDSQIPAPGGQSGTIPARIGTTTTATLAVNDYVELIATQNSGGALNVGSASSYTPEFMMVRVG